jgi:hypothetical protein
VKPVRLPAWLALALAGALLSSLLAGAYWSIRAARAEQAAGAALSLLQNDSWPATDSEVEAAELLRLAAEGGAR